MWNRVRGVLGAAALLLGGLAGGTAARADLLVWSDATRVPAFQAYQQSHPDAKLRIVTVDPNQIVAKIKVAMAAHADVPDIIFITSVNIPAQLTTARGGYLLDLTSLVPKATIDGFAQDALKPCQVDGKLLCLRNDIAQDVFWYDAASFKQFGYEVPATFEQFEALGLRLGKEHPGYILGTASEPYLLMGLFFASNCPIGFPVADAPDTLRVDLTGPECLRVARMVDHLVAAGTLSELGPFEPGYAQLAQDGKLLGMIGPSWFGDYIYKPSFKIPAGRTAAAPPFKWDTAPRVWTGAWGGGSFGAAHGVGDPKAAADLLLWLTTSTENQVKAPTYPAYRPAVAAWATRIAADPFYAADPIPALRTAADEVSPGHIGLRFELSDAFGKVATPRIKEGGSLEAVLPQLQEEITNAARAARYKVVTQ